MWGILWLLIFITIMVTVIYESFSKKRMIKRFLSNIEVQDLVMHLPRPMKITVGKVILYDNLNPSRDSPTISDFIPISTEITDKIVLKPEDVKIAIDNLDYFYISSIGYRIEEKEFKDIVLLPIIPSYKIKIPENTIIISKDNEYAYIQLSSKNSSLLIEVSPSLTKSRGIRIELSGLLSTDVDTRQRWYLNIKKIYKKVLGESKSRIIMRYDFFNKNVVLVYHSKVFDSVRMGNILHSLLKDVFLFHYGAYSLEAILDVPFAPDVRRGTKIVLEKGNTPMSREVEIVSLL